MIAVVLKAALKEYASVLTNEQQKRGNMLELTHLRILMSKYYCTVYKKNNDQNNNQDNKMQLSGTNQNQNNNKKNQNNNDRNGQRKWFKGKCFICEKRGHMAKSCWQKKKNQNDEDNNKTNREVSVTSANIRQSKEIQSISLNWEEQIREFEDEENEEVYKNFMVSAETDD